MNGNGKFAGKRHQNLGHGKAQEFLLLRPRGPRAFRRKGDFGGASDFFAPRCGQPFRGVSRGEKGRAGDNSS